MLKTTNVERSPTLLQINHINIIYLVVLLKDAILYVVLNWKGNLAKKMLRYIYKIQNLMYFLHE